LKNIKGRHWVFIVGFMSAAVASIWSFDIADNILLLLFIMGMGMAIFRRY